MSREPALNLVDSESPRKKWPKYVPMLFDVHIPFHDSLSWRICLDIISHFGADSIVLGGDFLDFYNISSYPKSNKVKESFEDEIFAANKALDQLEQFGVPIGYYEGNHEYRLQKLISAHPFLFGQLDIQRLLKFEKRRIHWIPYDPHQGHKVWGSQLHVKHVPETTGKYPAAITAERTGLCFATGHVHRFSVHYVRFFDRLVKCYSSGSLADFKSEVMSYVIGFNKWHQGFLWACINQDGSFTVDPVSIENGRATLWGKTFK